MKVLTYSGLIGMIVVPTVVLLLRGPTGEFGDGWWSAGVVAVAEAILVAGVLGVTVDRLLKTVLVRDIARLTLRTIFGTNAPQDYVNSLQNRLERIQILHIRITWSMNFSWLDQDETLEVQTEWDVDSVNVSSRTWEPRQLRLKHSMSNASPSRFDSFRTSIRVPVSGNRADLIHATTHSASELLAVASLDDDGSVRIEAKDLHMKAVPPGALRSATLRGTTLEPPTGIMPLTMSSPSLHVSVKMTGDALTDLDIDISGGVDHQSLTKIVSADCVLYDHGFVFPGTTFVISWSKKTAQARTADN